MSVIPSAAAIAELAPGGVVRAGVNLSNFLLVTGRAPNGAPQGISPDLAAAVAERLSAKVEYVSFETPAKLADAAGSNAWDIGLIGAEPQRAESIAFSKAYLEIEATYLVPSGSPIRSIAEVDREGVRVVAMRGSAYGLWLERNLKHATLVHANSIDDSYTRYVSEGTEALAGLRPRLIADVGKRPGSRILDGRFTAVQQAVGTPKNRAAGAAFLAQFIEEAKSGGLIAKLIEKHGVKGVTVAA